MSYIYNLTDSWTAVGTSYSGIKMAITNTASAASSYMLDLTISGATTASFQVDKSGNLVLTGSVNKVTFTPPATGSTLTIANGKTFTASNTLTITGTDGSNVAFGTGGTVAYTANNLSVFASTTSAQLAGVISDETGSGALVFATSPSLTTPNIGVATATSVNKITFTAPATSATVTPTDGTTTVLSGGTLREVLTANRNYYVRTDGSDSNNGLTNTAGGAFLTIQKAITVAYGLDLSIYNVVINIAAGTYTGNVNVTGPHVGSGNIVINGDVTTPSNVVISTTGFAISVTQGAQLVVQGVKLTAASSAACINIASGAIVTLGGQTEFGACASGHHVYCDGGYFISSVAEIISGNVPGAHYLAANNGYINCQYATWTASGSVSTGSFAQASGGGILYAFGNTSSGTFTGGRYYAALNGVINTNGGGANYFPGNSAGSTATGGQYA